MTQPADETVRLICKGVIDAERLSRYYGYLAHRLRRLSELLSITIVIASMAGVFTIMSPLPRWVPLLMLGIAAASSMVKAVEMYEEKAAYSGELYRQMGRLSIDWQHLWVDVDQRDEKELREAWRNLSRRQRTTLLLAPGELPLSNKLMLRSRREAEQQSLRLPRTRGDEPLPACPYGPEPSRGGTLTA